MFEDNADLYPWAAGFMMFVTMFGATIVSESLGVLWRERNHWGFWHPLTQYRLVLLGMGVVFVLGTGPDVAFLLTYGQVSLATSSLIRRLDLFIDMGTILPMIPVASLLALSRWRIRDSLSRGAHFPSKNDTYIEYEDATFVEMLGKEAINRSVHRPVFKTLPGLDIRAAVTRVGALIVLSILAAGAVTIQWQSL